MYAFGGEYTRELWGRGIRLALRPRGRGLILRVVFGLIAAVSAGLIVHSLIFGEGSGSDMLWWGLGALLLGYYAAAPYYRAWQASTRPFRRGAERPGLAGVVTGEGIVSNASATDEPERWETFLRAHVRDDLVVLIGSDSRATILPRAFFRDESDWQGFRQMVRFNVVEPK